MSNIDINTVMSGLVPFEKYDYVFEGTGGNWPCVVTPYSGTFRPYSDSLEIKAKVHFCSSKDSCSSGVVGLLPYNSGICDPSPNLYTTLRVSLKPESLNQTLYTNTITVNCENCFGSPTITTPSTVNLTQAQGNEYALVASVVGLQPNKTYNFNFSSIDANWPVRVNPSSGTIKTPRDRTNIAANLAFCYDPLLCNGALDYTATNQCLLEKNLYSILQLSIQQADCNTETVTSNPIPIYCKDCLPSTTIKLISAGTRRVVENAENTVGVLIEPTIVGLKPNAQYSYVFKSIDSNWPVFMSPVSGQLQSSSSSTSISSQLFFCSSTGICPSGSRGVLNYRLDDIQKTKVPTDPFVNLQLELTSLSCGTTFKSDNVILYCNDCIVRPDARIVSSNIT